MNEPANSQQSANTEPAKKAPAKKAPAKKAPAKKAPAKKAPAKKAPAKKAPDTDPYRKASNLGASSFATLRLVEVHCDEAVNSRTTHIVKLASYARANPRVRAIVFEQLARVENGSVPYDAPQNELVVRMLGDLLMTIPTIGLQEPPSIRYIRRTPHLHVGYRRYAALLFLYGPDHKQLFSVTTIDGDDQLIANLTENVARRSLTSYEEATRYSEIRDNDPKRWTPAMLAARTSRSPSHVENLMRARSKLHPTLVEQWKVLGHTAPLKVLISICSKKLSEQLAAWREYTDGSRAGGEAKVRFAFPPMTVRAMRSRLRPYREQASPSWLASGGSSYLEGAEAAFASVLDGFPFELPHGAVDDPDDDDVTASPIPSFHSAVPPMGDPSQPQEHAD